MAAVTSVNETLLHIQQHDNYFCRALEMVPRHLTTEVDVQEQLNTRYFKVRCYFVTLAVTGASRRINWFGLCGQHRKVPLTAEEKRARSKAEKKARYDPAGMKISVCSSVLACAAQLAVR